MNINNISKQEYSVALYIRLSKEDGDKEESESVTNQRKILRTYAEENGYTIYDEYVDDGFTGTNFNRPSFKRMIADIESKKVNMVITKNLARLGRDYIETGRYIESYFPENEVRYIAVLDDVDTFLDKNCDTVAFKNIMNDYYARDTSRNIKKTKNRKKKEGFYYTSYAPFGYKKVSKSGQLEIDETQAKIVREIFKMFIEGNGSYRISRILTERKIMPPGIQMEITGVLNNATELTYKWNHNSIRRMLENPIYIGKVVQNKTKKISYKSKKMITLSKNENTIIENHHEPIISLDDWNTVQKMLKINKNTKVRETDVLFKGLVYCAHCNGKMGIRIKKEKRVKKGEITRRYMFCQTAVHKYTNKKCSNTYINYDKFEMETIKKITEILEIYVKSNAFKNEGALEKILHNQGNRGNVVNKIESLNEELDATNRKIRMLYNDKLNGLLEEQDYVLFSENLTVQRHKIEDLLAETKRELEEYEEFSTDKRIEANINKIIKRLVRKQIYTKEDLTVLINRIEVNHDRKVVIYFNFRELNCIGGELYYENTCNF